MRPHARVAISGDWAVFLDLKRSRYWATAAQRLRGEAGEAAPQGPVVGAVRVDPDLARQLVERGAAQTAPLINSAAPEVRRRRRRALFNAPPLLRLAGSLLWAQRRLADHSLARGLAELEAVKARAATSLSPAPAHAAQMAALWSYYERMRIWFPRAYVCLFDSLALAMFAARSGVGAELVFGVRGRPFAAHSWIEHDGAVVNDAPEYCASFTPILRA